MCTSCSMVLVMLVITIAVLLIVSGTFTCSRTRLVNAENVSWIVCRQTNLEIYGLSYVWLLGALNYLLWMFSDIDCMFSMSKHVDDSHAVTLNKPEHSFIWNCKYSMEGLLQQHRTGTWKRQVSLFLLLKHVGGTNDLDYEKEGKMMHYSEHRRSDSHETLFSEWKSQIISHTEICKTKLILYILEYTGVLSSTLLP